MSYFRAGFWHFVIAVLWAIALGAFSGSGRAPLHFPNFPGDDPLYWLRQPAFSSALTVSSSALFFIPDAWSKKGLMKFLHYPLPDWDVLLLGPASHRHWLTHSPVLPILSLLVVSRFPVLLDHSLPTLPLGAGLCAGIGSHLFWDCVGSRRHTIILVPYMSKLPEAASRFYLLAGAAISCGAALAFARLR